MWPELQGAAVSQRPLLLSNLVLCFIQLCCTPRLLNNRSAIEASTRNQKSIPRKASAEGMAEDGLDALWNNALKLLVF
jgi:hypothetical protein